MKNYIDFDVASFQVATHAINLLKIEGTVDAGAAAGLFLQLHDSQLAPANGAVPVKSWPVTPDTEFYKEFKDGDLSLNNGCYVCLSTTEATKTAGAGTDLLSTISVETVEADPKEGVTVVGDLTTQVSMLQVWDDAGDPKKLVRLQVVFGTGQTRYALLFAKNNPVDGDIPIAVLASGQTETKDLNFGVGGRAVNSTDADGTAHDGCTVAISTTVDSLTGVDNNSIRAEIV